MTVYVIREEPVPSPATETIHVGMDGKRVYPCRCGQTHDRPEDFYHHECFHDQGLWEINPGYLMCVACAKTFLIVKGDSA